MEVEGGDRARARPFAGGQCRAPSGGRLSPPTEPRTRCPWENAEAPSLILAFPVWLVGDELAVDVTAEASVGGLARRKGGCILGVWRWGRGTATPAEGRSGCHDLSIGP